MSVVMERVDHKSDGTLHCYYMAKGADGQTRSVVIGVERSNEGIESARTEAVRILDHEFSGGISDDCDERDGMAKLDAGKYMAKYEACEVGV